MYRKAQGHQSAWTLAWCKTRLIWVLMALTATSARPLALGSSPAVRLKMMPLDDAHLLNDPENSWPLSVWILATVNPSTFNFMSMSMVVDETSLAVLVVMGSARRKIRTSVFSSKSSLLSSSLCSPWPSSTCTSASSFSSTPASLASSIAGSSPWSSSSGGWRILSESFGTRHTKTPVKNQRAMCPPRSYAGVKGPATSRDKVPVWRCRARRWGSCCWRVSWHVLQSLR